MAPVSGPSPRHGKVTGNGQQRFILRISGELPRSWQRTLFGSGYKRVVQDLRDITTDGSAEPGALATARGTLTYPQDWSLKSGADELRPHLSSIDALVMAATLAEVHVSRAFGLTAAEQRRTWLQHADVRAGSSPHEDLSDFPVRGRLLAVDGPASQQSELTSTFDCRIGGLRVRCTLAHERGAGHEGLATYADAAEALGPARARHYGEGYKHRDQHADQVYVNLDRQRVRGRQRVVATERDAETHGAEAAYGPSVSLVDALVGWPNWPRHCSTHRTGCPEAAAAHSG
ncbi:AvrD family protein [Streptomyces sp. M10(2022)]